MNEKLNGCGRPKPPIFSEFIAAQFSRNYIDECGRKFYFREHGVKLDPLVNFRFAQFAFSVAHVRL